MSTNAITGRLDPTGGGHAALFGALFGVVALIAAAAAVWRPAAIVAVIMLVSVLALKYPLGVGAALIVAGVALPDYIGAQLHGFGVVVNGRLLVSVLLLYAGLIATRDNRSAHVRHVQWAVAFLAVLWLVSAFVATSGAFIDRLQATTHFAIADVTALVGATLLACAPGGRRRLLLALTAAGVLAAVLAVAELAAQRNLLLEYGLNMDLGADAWKRAPGAFRAHPLLGRVRPPDRARGGPRHVPHGGA